MNPLKSVLRWYFSRNALPYWCLLFADFIIIFFSALFSYWMFERTLQIFDHRIEVLTTSVACALLYFVGARIFHTYLGVVRFSSFVDLLRVAYANSVSVVLVVALKIVMCHLGVMALCALTKVEILVAFVFATMLMWAMRVIVKTLFDLTSQSNMSIRVLIYGAMSGGVGLAKHIRSQRPRRYRLCGFISHDKYAKHMQLMGEKVYYADESIVDVIKQEHIQAVLVSPLKINEFRNNQEIQDIFIKCRVKIYIPEQMREMNIKNGELSEEDMQGMQLKEVSVEDLLPRQEIEVDMDSVGNMLRDRRVLITGSAGSIGSEIVRQVAAYKPAEMMLIDQAESPQHDIRLMMANDFPEIKAETVVTSISRQLRMEAVFSKFRPDYVFHAAAYKHVPMMEDNPSEAVLNNICGTKIIADLSIKYGVKKFVMVSTDKAVNPTNVMGCSKRICEMYVQAQNHLHQGRTQFVTTRFGNVLGSNGSVIPLFREQIKKGGPVTVTDPRIVRFFMLISEACKLVLEAGTKGQGGDIFVFDMGKPVKIADLAQRMIMLSGAANVEIKYTGLRPGEKLYEEVLNELEGTKPSFHEKIRIASEREYDYEQVCHDIEELIVISKNYDNMATVRKMKQIVPEYKSNNSVYEVLD